MMQEIHQIAFASRSLTQTEQSYAQIEIELLAIYFSVEKFYIYIYGQRNVTVATDHKTLITIHKINLNDESARLQRILLKQINYDISLK